MDSGNHGTERIIGFEEHIDLCVDLGSVRSVKQSIEARDRRVRGEGTGDLKEWRMVS